MQWINWIGISVLLCFHVCRPTYAKVPPPTNLTLQCHNLKNILYWNYSEASLQPRFTVDIGAISEVVVPECVETANYYCDLSFLRPNDEYSVTVTAVVGHNTSVSEEITFSYLTYSLVDQTCYFDLPSTIVTDKSDDTVHFSFLHPGIVYRPNVEAEELHDFEFTVGTGDTELKEFTFTCMKHVCAESIPVDGRNQDHCVSIGGQWNGFTVRAVQKYCVTSQDAQANRIAVYLAVCGLLFLCGAVVLTVMLVYKKTCTGFSPFPSSMKITRIMTERILPTGQREAHVLDVENFTSGDQQSTEVEERSERREESSSSLEPDVRPLLDSGSGSLSSASEKQSDGYNLGRDLDGDVEERESDGEDQSASSYMHRERLAEDGQ